MISQNPLHALQHPVVNRSRAAANYNVYELEELLDWYRRNPTWPDARDPLDIDDIEEVDRGDGDLIHAPDGSHMPVVYRPLPYVQGTLDRLAEFRAERARVVERPPSPHLIGFRLVMMLQSQVNNNQITWLNDYWLNHPLTDADVSDYESRLQRQLVTARIPRPPPGISEGVRLAHRKAFRLRMCEMLFTMTNETMSDPRYMYWRAHPLSRASGDDDDIIHRFQDAFRERRLAGYTITPHQIPYLIDLS